MVGGHATGTMDIVGNCTCFLVAAMRPVRSKIKELQQGQNGGNDIKLDHGSRIDTQVLEGIVQDGTSQDLRPSNVVTNKFPKPRKEARRAKIGVFVSPNKSMVTMMLGQHTGPGIKGKGPQAQKANPAIDPGVMADSTVHSIVCRDK